MLIYRYKERLKEEKSIEQKRKSEAGREERQEAKEKQEKTLEKMTVPELKEMAKEKGIEGYSTMKKDELIKKVGDTNG